MNNNRTYAGIPKEFSTLERSKTALITVPYDGTSTWGKGADKGPEAFLEASENMELYDIETDSEVYKEGVFLNEMPQDFESPDDMVVKVHDEVKELILKNKFVTLFGGEHSVSIGSIRAFSETFQNLTVLQIDAHADLRNEYDGTPYNHACAMHEASKTTNLVQVGIRSMDISEKKFMNTDNVFFAHQMAEDDFWQDKALDLLTENVYITIDLDGFDPAIFPGTGTPEPGGLYWYETLAFLRNIFETKNVVGFDIVELCPSENDRVSPFNAAKLYYKMLSYKFQDNWI
ncbi:MAG: agmatinase [Flavobacteriales bacterium]|nr:agmatinase [Flavobacteriales bacterium]